MSIEWSLAALISKVEHGLPPLCNVTVEFAEAPRRVSNTRWEILLVTPTSGPKVVLAVHDNPFSPDLPLRYPKTATPLLDLLSDDRLRALFRVGETSLIQCEPHFSKKQNRLFLNVESILLIRPWRTFGRRQIDFAASCARKHFLSLSKGARTRINPHLLTTWQSLAGHVAHDLIEAAADQLPAALNREDSFIRSALTPMTALRLVVAGARNLSLAVTAITRGLGALEVLANSPALTDLLTRGGPWLAETSAFDRGVTLTPDLVGDRVVAELKRQSPESAATRRETTEAQARGYLAWAMVTYGVDQVAANWRAAIVNVHERVPEAERITSVTADRGEIAQRVFNRHRLLALADGSWLPQPDETECNHCEFHKPDPDIPNSPPACQFHCQAERSWDCANLDSGTTCPLYNKCNEHNRFHDFRMLDLFNRLRNELAEEDEEGEAAIHSLAENKAWHWGPFTVAAASNGDLRLIPPPEYELLDGVSPGQVFDVRTEDAVITRARFRRIRNGSWQFVNEDNRRLELQKQVWLIPAGISVYPARAQLTYLDRQQRAGAPPGALRYAGQHRPPIRVYECPLESVPADADAVVVDAPTGIQQFDALMSLLPQAPSRVLILIGPNWDSTRLPPGAVFLDEFEAHNWINHSDGPPVERLKTACERLAEARVVAAPWDLLTSDLFDGWQLSFDIVVITDAHALPSLALGRAAELYSQRIILIGAALAGGPSTESVNSLNSVLFANLVVQSFDTGGALLPERIQKLALVRMRAPIASGLSEIMPSYGDSIPVIRVRVESDSSPTAAEIELKNTTKLAPDQKQSVRIEAKLARGTDASYRSMRALMSSLTSGAFQSLLQKGLPEVGSVDRSLLGKNIVVTAASTSFTRQENELILKLRQHLAPLSMREGISSSVEADAIVARAKLEAAERFVVTSPYPAQCRLIAKAAHAAGVDNVRVLLPGRVSWRAQQERSILVLSLAASDGEYITSWPYTQPGNLLPLLTGNWKKIEVFCSDAMLSHPIIAGLSVE